MEASDARPTREQIEAAIRERLMDSNFNSNLHEPVRTQTIDTWADCIAGAVAVLFTRGKELREIDPRDTGGRVNSDLSYLNASLWLQGDEDGGVGMNCRRCDLGGAPIAYYEPYPNGRPPYEGTDVKVLTTISALIFAGAYHLARHHGETPEEDTD